MPPETGFFDALCRASCAESASLHAASDPTAPAIASAQKKYRNDLSVPLIIFRPIDEMGIYLIKRTR
ncbi:hypothetical protein [Paraburkholderia sp. BR14320]|uniref:hypothetical protein n=1 Tax=unclassified Paraburkholderia TaxID=2615204 RepID=UPI0034CEFFFD